MKIWQKIVAVTASFALLFNSLAGPLSVLAQESPTPAPTETASPNPQETVTPSPTDSATPTATPNATPTDLVTPTPEVTSVPTEEPTVTPTPSPSPWTFEKVELNREYISPQNNKVRLTFTKLPSPSGSIKIEEITLTEDQIKETGSLSNKAYDITSDMEDGSFTYNLSLPIPESSKDKGVEVKFAETVDDLSKISDVTETTQKEDDIVTVSGLEHLTVFIITGTAPPVASNIIDDGDANFSTNVSWSNYAAGMSGDHKYTSNSTAGKWAKWTFTDDQLPVAGQNYTISANWDVWSDHVKNVVYKLYDNNDTLINTFTAVDQSKKADGTNALNGTLSGWKTFSGTFTLQNGYYVQLETNGGSSRNIVADAIKIETSSAPSEVWVDKSWFPQSAGTDLGSDKVYGYNAFSNIQDGITAVASGGTINVAAGTYNESLDIAKSLTIQGAGQATTFIDQLANAAAGNVVYIHGASGDAKVDGFTIKTGPASSVASSGIVISGLTLPGTITISNNTIWAVQGSTLVDNMGLYASSALTTTKLVFDSNTVHGGGGNILNPAIIGNPILLERWMGPADITNNHVDNGVKDILSSAIFIMNYGGTHNTQKQLIKGNFIDVGWGTSVNSSRGIVISGSYNTNDVGGFSNVEISNNTISNLKTSRIGIWLRNRSANGSDGEISNAVISGNTISSATGYTGDFGIRVDNKNVGTQITNNTIGGVADAVRFEVLNTFSPSGAVVNNNSLIATTYGVNNLTTNMVDAINNWWGSASGPYDNKTLPGTPNYNNPSGTGNSVSSYVDYKPWYKDAAMTTLSNVAPATPSLISPADGSVQKPAALILDWSDITDLSMPVTYVYQASFGSAVGANNALTSPIYTSGTLSVSEIDASGTGDGTYYWQAKACDNLSNCSAWSGPWTVMIDGTPPTVPGTPITTSPTNSPTQTWMWTAATDALSGIASYAWRVAGGPSGSVLGTSTSAITNLLEGVWNFFVKAIDNAGNQGSESSGSVTVDTTSPNAPTPTSPADGAAIQPVAFSQTWTAEAGAVQYKYQSCNVDPGDLGATCTSIKFEQTLSGTTKNVGAGQPNSHFWWRVQAKDAVGNWSLHGEAFELTIDGTAPSSDPSGFSSSPAISTPSNDQEVNVSWTTGGIDALSGVDGYSYDFTAEATDVPDNTKDLEETATNATSTTLVDGTWYFHIRTVDNAGNWTSTSHFGPFVMDTSAPETSIDSGPTGYVSNTSATFAFSADETSTFECQLDGEGFSTCTSSTTYNDLADGEHTFDVRAKDTADNTDPTPASQSWTVDTTNPNAPTFVSSSHTTSVWNSDRSIDISWIATDPTPGSGIAGYSYLWNLNSTTVPDEVSEGAGTSNTSTNRPTSQTIWFHVRAVDALDHWGSTLHYGPFWIDAANPTNSWVNPLGGANLSGIVNLQVNANDVGSGLKFVRFRYQPSGGTFVTIVEDTSSPYSTDWDTTGLADGSYVLRARAEDNSGRTNIKDITVTVDNMAPTGSWVTPVADSTVSGIVPLDFAATDDLSDIQSVMYQFKAEGAGSFQDIIGTNWNTTGLTLGNYTLRALVTDNAGNVAGDEGEFDENVGVAAVVSGESSVTTGTGAVTITWTTDRPTSSRVVYDTVQHSPPDLSDPNFGYDFTTSTFDTSPKVLTHSVTIDGLSSGTLYYYRVVSAGSPVALGNENEFRTFSASGAPAPSGGAVLGLATTAALNAGVSKMAYFGGSNDGSLVLGTETITSSPEPTATVAPTLPETKFNLLVWMMGHKKISLGVIFALLLIAYILYRRSKKNK